jgi:hypothetical protein
VASWQELNQNAGPDAIEGRHMTGKGVTRRALLGNIAMLGVATGPGRAFAGKHPNSPVYRDFSNPYLELIRLLREAAEIEHDLIFKFIMEVKLLKLISNTIMILLNT